MRTPKLFSIQTSNVNPDALGAKYVRTTRFAIISSGTTGQVALPSNSQVVLDDFGGTVDAVVTEVESSKPTLNAAATAAGAVVATTFDSDGNWAFSGTPASYPVAIVYRVQQQLTNFDSTATDIWGEPDYQRITSAISLGGDTDVYKQTNGSELEFRGLSQGQNISLSESASAITIGITGTFGVSILTGVLPVPNGGTGSTLFTQGSVIFAGLSGLILTQDNSNLFWNDSTNRLGIGTPGPLQELHVVGDGLFTASQTEATVALRTHSTLGFHSSFFLDTTRGTTNTPAISSNNDTVGLIYLRGYDGSAYTAVATIAGVVDGSPAFEDMPGRIEFSTTPDGTSSPTLKMTIKNSGNVGIGTASPEAKLDVSGLCRTTDSASIPTTGSGLELFYTSGAGYLQSYNRTGAAYLPVNINGSDVLINTFAGTGEVGIGTASPSAPLHLYRDDTDVTDAGILIEQDGTGDAALSFSLTGAAAWSVGLDNSDSDKFKISASSNVGSSNIITVQSDGLVGVGTTGPTSRLTVTGSLSAAAWTSTGIVLNVIPGILTDTTSSGTVGANYVSRLYSPTLAASNSTTYTAAATLFVAGAPAAGSNVTITSAYSIFASGKVRMSDGQLSGGSQSIPSWTVSGPLLDFVSSVLTDTTGSGTITTRVANSFGAPSFASSSSVTVTNAATIYIAGPPTAGSNTTITNAHALYVVSGIGYFGGNIGVGLVAPAAKIHVDAGTATASAIKFTAGTTTGQTSSDGCEAGIDTSGNMELRQRENLAMNFFTNNTQRFSLSSAGVAAFTSEVRVAGDVGGAASNNTLTGTSDLTANSSGVGTILFKGTTNRNSSGFIKFYIGTTAYYVPVFSAITG